MGQRYRPGLHSKLQYFLTGWPWADCLNSLILSFFTVARANNTLAAAARIRGAVCNVLDIGSCPVMRSY